MSRSKPVHPSFEPFTQGVQFSGDVRADMAALLTRHGCAETAVHCERVAAEARRLANKYGLDASRAECAGWLHDVSAVIPLDQRAPLAQRLGLPVLPEEAGVPMLLHQKLSACLAREAFGLDDPAVLSAIGCHTTLRADATPLDQVVFVADKIAWDGAGDPPYLEAIVAAVERSLDQAAWCYLDYLWQRRATLPVVHPYFVAAHRQLAGLTRLQGAV